MIQEKLQKFITWLANIDRTTVIKLFISIILLAAVIFGVYKWYDSTHLRLMTVEPKNQSNASQGSWIRFRFNKPLHPDTAKNFTIDPNVNGNAEVKGKDLIFYPSNRFNVDWEYTATLSSAMSADGKYKAKSSTTKFKITYDGDLPEERYKDLVNQVDVDDAKQPLFDGIDAFESNGITADQQEDLRQKLRKFKPNAMKFIFDVPSITPDPNNTVTHDYIMTFDIKIDDVSYKAKMNYTELDTITLILTDDKGAQAFDSSQN